MGRRRGSRRGQLLWLLVAAGSGYVLGTWNAPAVRSEQPSPAQTVAARFPRDWDKAGPPQAASMLPMVMAAADTRLALFDPEPMATPAQPQVAAPPAQGNEPIASAPTAAVPQAPQPTMAMASAEPEQPTAAAREKPRAAISIHRVKHDGFRLDAAEIGRIRQRLHLTPDQARMWPAVAEALRNFATARARDPHRPGVVASPDPNSQEVQDLKYAALPLLMSFDDEQKNEVRNLAHSMGLDQLASQF